MDKNFDHVENMCISTCKTLFISIVKLCVFFHYIFIQRAKLHFPTYFSNVSHSLFHNHSTSVIKQSFPLFHTPYYYYYNFLDKY